MEIVHFSHEHPLTLIEKEKKGSEEACCNACKHSIDGDQVYTCSLCNFFLHKQCAKLTREILHPFHAPHPLTLVTQGPYKPGSCICDACRKTCIGFVYHCAKCKFDLGLECVSIRPGIKFEGHDHSLAFFDKLHGKNKHKCNVCYALCDDFVIRCVQCQFNFHIHCFPSLPSFITHQCHPCVLKLTGPNTLATRLGVSVEFYCGVCEKTESPDHSVYYCDDCNYMAHVECVISEVLSSLVMKRDNVAKTDQESILAKLDEEITKLRAEIDHALTKIDEDIKNLVAEISVASLAKLELEITKIWEEINALKAKTEVMEREHGARHDVVSEKPKAGRLIQIRNLWSRKG